MQGPAVQSSSSVSCVQVPHGIGPTLPGLQQHSHGNIHSSRCHQNESNFSDGQCLEYHLFFIVKYCIFADKMTTQKYIRED